MIYPTTLQEKYDRMSERKKALHDAFAEPMREFMNEDGFTWEKDEDHAWIIRHKPGLFCVAQGPGASVRVGQAIFAALTKPAGEP